MAQASMSMLLVGVGREVGGRLAKDVKGLTLEHSGASLPEVTEALARLKPASALVAVPPEGPADSVLKLVSQAAQAGTRVIVLGATKDADLILRAMRAGAQEYVVSGQEAELAEIVRAHVEAVAQAAQGQIVAIFGAKGGVGATTTAINLAGAFARGGERTCLVDLDLEFGDVHSILDLSEAWGVGQMLAEMARLDRDLFERSAPRHKSGFCAIGPAEHERPGVSGQEITSLLAFLRRHHRHVVLDGARGFGERSVAACEASDRILLVVTQEVPAVRNAQRSLEELRRMGLDGKVALVINRFLPGAKISSTLVSETVGAPIFAALGNDFRSVLESVHKATLVAETAPHSALARDFDRLALELGGAPTPAPGKRPLLARLLRR